MANKVVCMRWGEVYTQQHVDKLYEQVKAIAQLTLISIALSMLTLKQLCMAILIGSCIKRDTLEDWMIPTNVRKARGMIMSVMIVEV